MTMQTYKVYKACISKIRHFFVSGPHNNHQPALLRFETSLIIIVLFLGLLFGAKQLSFFASSRQAFLSEVYPAIIASLTNTGRQAIDPQHLRLLTYNLALELAAGRKADDMISKGYFAHNSPNGKEPWDWIKETGYQYEYAGENLAINFADSIDVYQAWMNSPGHKANILNPHYTEIGVATRKTYINGRESIIVVQMFASPKPGYIPSSKSPVALGLGTTSDTSTTSVTMASTSADTSDSRTSSDQLSGTATLAVLGASTEDIGNHPKSLMIYIDEFATNPRLVGLIIYILFILCVNIVVIRLGYSSYHKNHKKSIFIAIFLLMALSIITGYFMENGPRVVLF